MIITVECNPGEESISKVTVSKEELNILNAVLLEIRRYNGYYPTGNYYVLGNPSPEDLYSNFEGFNILEKLLPMPLGGFSRISDIEVFSESPITLYM